MGKNKKWYETLYTYFWVFNVGRGLAICARFPQNYGFIYDEGSSDDFSPRKFMEENIVGYFDKYDGKQFAQVILSHPHADHIAEIANESGKYYETGLWTCPHDKDHSSSEYKDEKVNFKRINNPDDKKSLIDSYRNAYAKRTLPLQTIRKDDATVPNVEYGIFYARPPECEELYPSDDQKYSNSISMVFYMRHGNQNILIPGDITPEAFEKVLEGDISVERRYSYFDSSKGTKTDHLKTGTQPILKNLLEANGLSVYVAPHHGLESCYCDKIYDYLKGGKPDINVISDKRITGENDGKIKDKYQKAEGANGLTVNIEGEEKFRYSVSTKNNHHILIVFKGTGSKPSIYLRKDPKELLDIVP